MKKRGAGKVFVRMGLLTLLATGGVLGYQKIVSPMLTNPDSKNQVNQRFSGALGKVEGIASTLHLSGLLDVANKKLMESQPIISDQVNNTAVTVLGDTTGNFTDNAREFVQNTTAQITDKIKDLPRQEAVNITKSVCEQIIKDLEKK